MTTFSISMVASVDVASSALAQFISPDILIPPTLPSTVEQTIPQAPFQLPDILFPNLIPQLQSPLIQDLPSVATPSEERILINKIEVRGNSVLQEDIEALIQPYRNRAITFEELLQLRSLITQLYIKNGYITSGAFLPNNQDLSRGTVRIQVVEGKLEQIEIEGLRQLQEEYVRSRLLLATSTPLNQKRLEEALQLLQIDPLIEQVNAELSAGTHPGSSILQVKIKESPPIHGSITIDNSQSPSIGSLQRTIEIDHNSLLGFGDRLNTHYAWTEGLNLYDISYTLPINPRNGTLSFRYNNGKSQIIEEDFRELGIRSETQSYSLSFRQPILRTPTREFALGLSLDLRRNQTYILDSIPFSFTEGAENGESKVTVIRFSQNWVDRNTQRVLAARSQLSLGINAFDATINNGETDGQFFSWLGQFQWAQQLSSRSLLVTRIDTQLTSDSLLSLERFSLGGIDTIRGYRQNQFVVDNGISASVELQIPLTYNSKTLNLTSFVEIGTGWNRQNINSNPSTIASLGLGLRWLINPNLSLHLDYGVPLILVENQGNSLQENGLYFSVRYQPF